MSDIFGGKKATSQSTSQSINTNKDLVDNMFSGMGQNGAGASNQMADMLGLNGNASQSQGFNNWKQSTGYQFGLNQGEDSITGNAATQGLLNSGSTLKSMNTYGQNYADTKYGDYMNQLQGLMNGGLGAGGLIANVGQQSDASSNSKSVEKPGITKLLGSMLAKGG